MIVETVTYPDPRLRYRSAPLLDQDLNPLTKFSSAHEQLFVDLIDTMQSRRGIGLAAIQIGYPLRVFVLDDNGPIVFVNPEIKMASADKVSELEGCLSFPGIGVKVSRSASVTVTAYSPSGELFEYSRSGLMARAVQHEHDHLDGITFFDRISHLSREVAKKRYKRINNPEKYDR